MTTFIAPVTKLTRNVIRILGCNPGPMTLQGTNSYLLGTGRRRVLVDTSEPNIPKYIQTLKQVLEEEAVVLSDIIISHWHKDHIGGVRDILENIDANVTVWKFPRAENEIESLPKGVNVKFLTDGQHIMVDGMSLKIVHTPGHTSDHIILWAPEDGILFSADSILGEGSTVFEDLSDYIKSLKLIGSFSAKVIFPGHGPIIENPEEKVKSYIEHRYKREEQIKEVLLSDSDKFFSSECIVEKLYTNLSGNLQAMAAQMITRHLMKLLKDGKVINEDDKWKIKSKI